MLTIAYKTQPCRGQTENGDAVVVRREGDFTLLSVVDALGHGPAAARAANAAVECLDAITIDSPLPAIIERLDTSLRGTRGAAAMVCRIRDREIEGCGVGNVELRTQGIGIPVLLTPGILGMGVRRPKFFASQIAPRARLLMFSDGIASAASFIDLRHLEVKDACETIFGQHARAHDDATLLIADVPKETEA